MSPAEGRRLLAALVRRARARHLLAVSSEVLAAALLGAGVAVALGLGGWRLAGVAFAGAFAAGALRRRAWRWRWPTPRKIAWHLDRRLPALEESASLLLRDPAGLGPLERLQERRLLAALPAAAGGELLPARPLRRALGALAASVLTAALFAWLPELPARAAVQHPGEETARAAGREAPLAPSSLQLEVHPPAYTGLPARTLEGFEAAVVEGSRVVFRAGTDPRVESAAVVVDEREELPLEAVEGGFRGERRLERSHLVSLRLERAGEEVYRSPYARLEVVPDAPPELEVLSPPRLLELAEPRSLRFALEARDDFGLASAELVLTLAQGAGEQVEFRERRLPLVLERGAREARLERWIDLAALGMEAGSELYLYAEVRDVREPEAGVSRTPSHRLRIAGEAAVSGPLGAGLPILPLPAFFRSQRQIILDTERLLAERPGLAPDEARRRSREIAFDQRALRLRYGALLGEEFESGRPVEAGAELEEAMEEAGHDPEAGHGHDHSHGPAASLPGGGEAGGSPVESGDDVSDLVASLPPGLVHQHDSAEVATFFPSEVRQRLKAALGEMWQAEEALHLAELAAALPYEYRALHLLKEAQQAARVYVERVGFEPLPFDVEERRLQGDLSEVPERSRRRDLAADAADEDLRRALAAVAALRRGRSASAADLEKATAELARQALENAAAVAPLEEMRRLIALLRTGDELPDDLPERLEGALHRLLEPPEPLPSTAPRADGRLGAAYFRRLGDEP